MQKIKKINWQKCFEIAWPYLIIIAAIFLLAEIQISNRQVILDIDTMFHYNRFNDIAEQFRTGHFSYFQGNYSFQQSGRIVNALYGPGFAYFNGFLVYLLGSWYNYQIVSYFILGILAGSGMYLLARKAKAGKLPAVMVAVLYINIGAIQAWFDHTNLTAWGAALAPFVFIEGINMVQDRQKPIRWIRLMLVMSLVGQTHLLSTLLLSLGLVPLAIIGFTKTPNKKQMLLDLVKAVGGTLLLTANVWGGLLLILKTNQIAPTFKHDLAFYALSINGLGTIRNAILGPTLFILLVQIVYAIITYKKSSLNLIVTVEGAIFLLMSSTMFPWEFLQENFKFLGNYLQFPHRLLTLAYPLLLLGIALSISQIEVKYSIISKIAICALGVIILENFGTNYARITQRSSFNSQAVYKVKSKKYYTSRNLYNRDKYYNYVKGLQDDYRANGINDIKGSRIYVQTATRGIYYKNTLDLDRVWNFTHDSQKRSKLFDAIIKVNPDYLPTYHQKVTGEDADYYYIQDVIKPRESGKFSYQVLSHGRLQLKWHSQTNKKQNLPLIMYKQSQLTLNGKVVSPKLSDIGTPLVTAKKGKNTAVLQFIVPLWFRILMGITVTSWLGLIGYGILQIKRRKMKA